MVIPLLEQSILQKIDPERSYGVSEIASITMIHPNTIRMNLKNGNLEGSKGAFTQRWWVKGNDLIEWLRKR